MHELAGTRVPHDRIPNIPELVTRYFVERPDAGDATQRVAFGTSGHRGTSHTGSFNEAHIIAVSAAIAEYRRRVGITGALFIGKDTHALSEAAFATAIEVLAAHDVDLVLDTSAYTPTPVISRAILRRNQAGGSAPCDGIVITPSHNPPEDGGFKYNPPTGGPADTQITSALQQRANELLERGLTQVPRVPLRQALANARTRREDLAGAYIEELDSVLDMGAIAGGGLRIGADPLGGAAVSYWDRISDRYGIAIDVVNRAVDAAFSFMTLDWDGRIRMDCSSRHAMAGLIGMKDRYDVAFGNDPDADRHGIVTPGAGLLNPNHYLAVAIWYLYQNRPQWSPAAAIGKTLVSSSIIDRIAGALGRRLVEVPVGFKWFVDGLLDGSMAFGGEESAGASFVRRDGSAWTTDKDGILLALLAAEITARSGRDPGELYAELEQRFGRSVYERTDAAATPEQKQKLGRLSPDAVRAEQLAGDRITARLTHAPGNGAAVGGLKVVTENGWFAARPSGTENVYKVYAESFAGEDHLRRIQREATEIVGEALSAG